MTSDTQKTVVRKIEVCGETSMISFQTDYSTAFATPLGLASSLQADQYACGDGFSWRKIQKQHWKMETNMTFDIP